jgi:hypothetical protein
MRPTSKPTFENYLADRRFMNSNLSEDGWLFVVYALGDPRYVRVGSWRELKHLLESDNVSPRLNRGAFLVWRSYSLWRRRKERDGLGFAYA